MLNILFLGSKNPGYSEWFTYVGLFRLFGTQVVDYPALEHIWERPADDVKNYVAQGWLGKEFDKGSVDRSEIKRKIDDGFFQLIIISSRAWGEYARLIKGQPNIVYLDGEDLPDIDIELITKENLLLYAKREVMLDLEDDHRILPFPFAFEKEMIPPAPEREKVHEVFGLFHSGSHPFRQEVMEQIPEYHHRWCRIVEPDERVSRQEYFRQMQLAEKGLSIRGYGFDTVRFWEILAAGLPLFSQRPIIKIPFLPKEGKEAVYFDNAGDLRTKLEAFKRMPGKCSEIAQAGHALFLARHTCRKRAEYLVEHALDARKQTLMKHSFYYHPPVQQGRLDISPSFASELAGIELEELSAMLPLAEADKREETAENAHPFNWVSLVKGHIALQKGKPYEAVRQYRKTGLRFFTSLLAEGVAHYLTGNRFQGNILWWKGMQQLELPLVQQLVQQGLTPDAHPERVALLPLVSGLTLEIGCGARKTSEDVIGIDLLQRGETGSFGVVKGVRSVADFKCSGDELYFFDDESVDAIILRHNIEHYQDYLKAVSEWSRVLKPGGLLGIVLPDDEQLDTIKLDETHKHTFTMEGVRNLFTLYPEFEIIELSVLLEKWSFLAVMQKKGGIPFRYSHKLKQTEVKESLSFLLSQSVHLSPSVLVQSLLCCFEYAEDKEETAPALLDILLKNNLLPEAERWMQNQFASLPIRNLLRVFLLLTAGKVTEAQEEMGKLSANEQEHALASYFSYLLSDAEGDKKEAWKALKKSLRRKPEQLHLLEKFASLTNELQLFDEALESIKEMHSLQKLSPQKQAYYRHFEVLLLIALNRKKEATEALHQLLSAYPYFEDAKPLLASLTKE